MENNKRGISPPSNLRETWKKKKKKKKKIFLINCGKINQFLGLDFGECDRREPFEIKLALIWLEI